MKLKWVYSKPYPALDTHKWSKVNNNIYKDYINDYKCSNCGLEAINNGNNLFFTLGENSFALAPIKNSFTYEDYLNFTCDEIIVGQILK